ncbi:Spherulation-specific family 4 [Coniochaeta sp. 2T2.1]|nr:Spherulation-specific family 4 [Coniochaeta sp. 2T2.1]
MAELKPFIFVPLYIYPTETSWQPLLAAAAKHPQLFFKVVVNPKNGPGPEALPDANYVTGLRALASLANVCVLGYIHCSWGERDQAELENDIMVYAGWTVRSPGIRIDGIFIDESPANAALVGYVAATARFVRKTFANPATVVYNPGVVVHVAFYQAADFIVIFENRASEWPSDFVQSNLSKLGPELRRKSIVIAHSCASQGLQLKLGRRLFQEYRIPGQLVTTQAGYASWCPYWESYWDEMRRWYNRSITLEGTSAGV